MLKSLWKGRNSEDGSIIPIKSNSIFTSFSRQLDVGNVLDAQNVNPSYIANATVYENYWYACMFAAPGSNAVVTFTVPAIPGKRYLITYFSCGFGGAIVGGEYAQIYIRTASSLKAQVFSNAESFNGWSAAFSTPYILFDVNEAVLFQFQTSAGIPWVNANGILI